MTLVDTGILLLRVLVGAAIAAHGAQKLFGWFGGYGLKGTGGFFEGLGFRPGIAFAALAGLSELAGGLLLILGLFTPLGAIAVLSSMLVAIVAVHLKGGFFASTNGIEMPFLYAVVAFALAFTGGGTYSLDTKLGLSLFAEPVVVGSLIVLAIIGTAVVLAIRRQPQAQASA
jgi:putative oxidoreductase